MVLNLRAEGNHWNVIKSLQVILMCIQDREPLGLRWWQLNQGKVADLRRTLNFNLYDLEHCMVGRKRGGIENKEVIAYDVKGNSADKGSKDL